MLYAIYLNYQIRFCTASHEQFYKIIREKNPQIEIEHIDF